ncbi:hypothetical protein Poly30_00860 [Planctomycetes bacterium Poly30]|uniref:Nickel uptake substrate-specific transmembrane region n=2 Tax=Saltatorellus ferox TaxID=2528018 RepID=A0A518EKH5_9BACT|nr:hypothetical protein Poly30_00860 [Planctomycetes bacterium Poly30]
MPERLRFAAEPDAAVRPSVEPLTWFSGVAVAAETGVPLEGVEVRGSSSRQKNISFDGKLLATTDASGRFRVKAPAGVDARPVALLSEFTGPALVQLHERDPATPQVIRLHQSASLFGSVEGLEEPARVMVTTRAYQLAKDWPAGTMIWMLDPEWTSVVQPGGLFELRGLPPRCSLSVSVRPAGDGPSILVVPEAMTLEPGEARELHLTAGSGATILGRVVDGEGAPISDIDVGLYASHVAHQGLVKPYWTTTSTARSAADGSFEFADVQAGLWYLGAVASSTVAEESDPHVRLAQTVEVPERGDVDVTLCLQRGLYVEGVVMNGQVPVHEARVFARIDASGVITSASPAYDGTFRIGPLPRGDVILRVMTSGSNAGPALIAPSEEVTVPAGTSGVVLRVKDGCAITMRGFDDESGQPVQAIFTVSSEGSMRSGREYQTVTTVDGLAPGRFAVRASTQDGRAGIVEGITLGAGEHADDVRVRIAPGGTIQLVNGEAGTFLIATLLRNDECLGTNGWESWRETSWCVPAGAYRVELVLLESDGGKSLEVHREERSVVVSTGETVEVHVSR